VDAKMWLYLIGAVMLELNVLSFASYHIISYGEHSSPGVILCTAMISFFIFDYLTFEEVHLYTYDFFAEKVGFKLGWGCLTFYPYFYSIVLFSTAHLPESSAPSWLFILSILIFLTGWSLARGANMQKFFFKTQPEKKFLGIKPETITNGNQTLLINGFWGLSRHINYLGEILMATGIVLSVGYPSFLLPWLYPLYYVVLLFPRQLADDKRCARKYGDLWNKYELKVKFRIIPFLY
jgi:protein-S-isoprenylcysteine O-methyltransferase Ste14